MADGLNWYRYVGNNPIKYLDPTGLSSEPVDNEAGEQWEQDRAAAEARYNEMLESGQIKSVSEFLDLKPEKQQEHLEEMVRLTGEGGATAGAASMHLRLLRSEGAMSDEMLDAYLAEPEGAEFMNIALRDAMNLNYDGTANYSMHQIENERDMFGRKVWKIGAAAMHNEGVSSGPNGEDRNSKYVASDGREVVFDRKGRVVTGYPNKGTYNYGPQSIKPGSPHVKYDMKPFTDYRKSEKANGTWKKGNTYD